MSCQSESQKVHAVEGNGEAPSQFNQALRIWLPSGIAGAAVTLTGAGTQAHLVTEDDGAFRFDGLTPGKYSILIAKDGYTLQGASPRSMCMPAAAGTPWECSLSIAESEGR